MNALCSVALGTESMTTQWKKPVRLDTELGEAQKIQDVRFVGD